MAPHVMNLVQRVSSSDCVEKLQKDVTRLQEQLEALQKQRAGKVEPAPDLFAERKSGAKS